MSNLEVFVDFLRWLAGLEPHEQCKRIPIPIERDEPHCDSACRRREFGERE